MAGEGGEEGWYVDPYGAHEARWFSEGTPTDLVRDGGRDSRHRPPDTPALGPFTPAPEAAGPVMQPGYKPRKRVFETKPPRWPTSFAVVLLGAYYLGFFILQQRAEHPPRTAVSATVIGVSLNFFAGTQEDLLELRHPERGIRTVSVADPGFENDVGDTVWVVDVGSNSSAARLAPPEPSYAIPISIFIAVTAIGAALLVWSLATGDLRPQPLPAGSRRGPYSIPDPNFMHSIELVVMMTMFALTMVVVGVASPYHFWAWLGAGILMFGVLVVGLSWWLRRDAHRTWVDDRGSGPSQPASGTQHNGEFPQT